MPLDKTDPVAIKWLVAHGKFDSNNLIHRFRFYRMYHGLSFGDIEKISDLEGWELDQFEQYAIGNCLVSYSVFGVICDKVEKFLESKHERVWEDYLPDVQTNE